MIAGVAVDVEGGSSTRDGLGGLLGESGKKEKTQTSHVHYVHTLCTMLISIQKNHSLHAHQHTVISSPETL